MEIVSHYSIKKKKSVAYCEYIHYNVCSGMKKYAVEILKIYKGGNEFGC